MDNLERYRIVLPMLREMLPPEKHTFVKKKSKGKVYYLPAVSWPVVAERLDEVVPGEWSILPPHFEHSGAKLVTAVGVDILGVVRWNVGDEMEETGEPGEDGIVRDFGSSSTNAWAQAFKRALAAHGVCSYLWDKSRKPEVESYLRPVWPNDDAFFWQRNGDRRRVEGTDEVEQVRKDLKAALSGLPRDMSPAELKGVSMAERFADAEYNDLLGVLDRAREAANWLNRIKSNG